MHIDKVVEHSSAGRQQTFVLVPQDKCPLNTAGSQMRGGRGSRGGKFVLTVLARLTL